MTTMNISGACPLCEATQEMSESADVGNISDVAEKHGIPTRLLKTRLGMEVRSRTTWDDERVSELQNALNSGASYTELGDRFGVGVARIKQVVKSNNLDVAQGNRARTLADIEKAALISDSVLGVYRSNPEQSSEDLRHQLGRDTQVSLRVDLVGNRLRALLRVGAVHAQNRVAE